VGISEWLPDGLASGEEHLVEGVPEVVKSVGNVFLELVRNGASLDELLPLLSGLAIFFDDFHKVIRCEEGVANAITSIQSAMCPVDEFLRLGEVVGHNAAV
jgi:hypothetical protein